MASSYVATNGNGFHASSNGGGLLTVAQVAHLLNAHPHSVRRWADSGLLPCYRIGVRGDRRFNSADVDAFLAAKSNGHGVGRMTVFDLDLQDQVDLPEHGTLVSGG